MVRLIVMPSLPFGKHRLLIALFHFITKVRQFANPRLLIKAAVIEFIGAFFLLLRYLRSQPAPEYSRQFFVKRLSLQRHYLFAQDNNPHQELHREPNAGYFLSPNVPSLRKQSFVHLSVRSKNIFV